MKQITVLIAEDHTVVREGLRQMLSGEKDLHVVGEAQDGRLAVAMARKLTPDVVLMDIAMPLLNGLEATRQILKACPAQRILVLSAHCDDAYLQSAVEAGAKGFLLKQSSTHELCDAIRAVDQGKTSFTSTVARRLEQIYPRKSNREGVVTKDAVKLTTREMETLQLIAEGKANKEIASDLGIGIKTVEKHREHLMKKLNLRDTAGITRYAISAGIIESSVQLTVV